MGLMVVLEVVLEKMAQTNRGQAEAQQQDKVVLEVTLLSGQEAYKVTLVEVAVHLPVDKMVGITAAAMEEVAIQHFLVLP